MFKAELSEKLQGIFDLQKVTFDSPGESQEQDVIFVEVESCKSKISPPHACARVAGKVRIFGNEDKMPYGYFSKRIAMANEELSHGLFFHDFEENAGNYRNIAERSMSFIYLYEGQYDPNVGEINEINLSIVES